MPFTDSGKDKIHNKWAIHELNELKKHSHFEIQSMLCLKDANDSFINQIGKKLISFDKLSF